MVESLLQVDRALTLTINHFHSEQWDTIMIMISEKLTWLPLYLGLLLLLIRKFSWKLALVLVAMLLINFGLTDQISVMMKNGFERFRPCKAPGVLEYLNLANGCGGKFGFVSSHAANTMGMAILASLILKKRWAATVLLIWAFLNSYSRVYLGKHYVGDVIGGMLLGLLLAAFVYQIGTMLLARFQPELRAEL